MKKQEYYFSENLVKNDRRVRMNSKVVLMIALLTLSSWKDVFSSTQCLTLTNSILEDDVETSACGSIEAVSEFIKSLGTVYGDGGIGDGGIEGDDTTVFVFNDQPTVKYEIGEGGRIDIKNQFLNCTTYVETVLAYLGNEDDIDSFLNTLIRIRYKEGKISFEQRNHFPSVDWIPNNIANGALEDVTGQVHEKFLIARAEINKEEWFKKLSADRIHIKGGTEEEKAEMLKELRSRVIDKETTLAELPYVSLKAIFQEGTSKGENQILGRIKSGDIINIVRPNWNIKKLIGTNMNVSHQGFAIRKKGILYFRHASSKFGKVVDENLEEYLRKYRRKSSIKGINILRIRADNVRAK